MPTIDELTSKLAAMSEPSLDVTQIAELFRCSRTTAGKIKRAAIREKGGAVRFNSRVVRTEAVFEVQGLDRAHEIDVLADSIRKMSGKNPDAAAGR